MFESSIRKIPINQTELIHNHSFEFDAMALCVVASVGDFHDRYSISFKSEMISPVTECFRIEMLVLREIENNSK